MIPQNLLGIALSIIGKQAFQYVRVLGRTLGTTGLEVNTYAAPINILGSVQAVPRDLFEKYGLNFQGNYKVFYVSQYVNDIDRNTGGDRFYFSGEIYQALSSTDWININGWIGIICVHVPGGCPSC